MKTSYPMFVFPEKPVESPVDESEEEESDKDDDVHDGGNADEGLNWDDEYSEDSFDDNEDDPNNKGGEYTDAKEKIKQSSAI